MKYDLDNSKDWGYERAADDSDTDMHADKCRQSVSKSKSQKVSGTKSKSKSKSLSKRASTKAKSGNKSQSEYEKSEAFSLALLSGSAVPTSKSKAATKLQTAVKKLGNVNRVQ